VVESFRIEYNFMRWRQAISGHLIFRISSQVGLFQSMTLLPALELIVSYSVIRLTEINAVRGYVSTVCVLYSLEV